MRQLRGPVHTAVASRRHRPLLVQCLWPLPQDEWRQPAAGAPAEAPGECAARPESPRKHTGCGAGKCRKRGGSLASRGQGRVALGLRWGAGRPRTQGAPPSGTEGREPGPSWPAGLRPGAPTMAGAQGDWAQAWGWGLVGKVLLCWRQLKSCAGGVLGPCLLGSTFYPVPGGCAGDRVRVVQGTELVFTFFFFRRVAGCRVGDGELDFCPQQGRVPGSCVRV